MQATEAILRLGIRGYRPGTGDGEPEPEAPAAPTGLAAIPTSSTSTRQTWTPPAGATAQSLERSLDGSTGWTVIATLSGSASSHDDTGLAASTTYYYRVRASNAAGDSPYSATKSATTPALPVTPPAAPTNLVATAITFARIDLNWTDNASDESGFAIEWSADGSTGWTALATPPANTQTYSHSGLPEQTTRYYRVKAVNAAGDSDWSNVASATTPASPGIGLLTPENFTFLGAIPRPSLSNAVCDGITVRRRTGAPPTLLTVDYEAGAFRLIEFDMPGSLKPYKPTYASGDRPPASGVKFWGDMNYGREVGGLVDNAFYFIKVVDADNLQFALTQGGPAVDLTGPGIGWRHAIAGEGHIIFDPENDVDTVADSVYAPGHGLVDGRQYRYHATRLMPTEGAPYNCKGLFWQRDDSAPTGGGYLWVAFSKDYASNVGYNGGNFPVLARVTLNDATGEMTFTGPWLVPNTRGSTGNYLHSEAAKSCVWISDELGSIDGSGLNLWMTGVKGNTPQFLSRGPGAVAIKLSDVLATPRHGTMPVKHASFWPVVTMRYGVSGQFSTSTSDFPRPPGTPPWGYIAGNDHAGRYVPPAPKVLATTNGPPATVTMDSNPQPNKNYAPGIRTEVRLKINGNYYYILPGYNTTTHTASLGDADGNPVGWAGGVAPSAGTECLPYVPSYEFSIVVDGDRRLAWVAAQCVGGDSNSVVLRPGEGKIKLDGIDTLCLASIGEYQITLADGGFDDPTADGPYMITGYNAGTNTVTIGGTFSKTIVPGVTLFLIERVGYDRENATSGQSTPTADDLFHSHYIRLADGRHTVLFVGKLAYGYTWYGVDDAHYDYGPDGEKYFNRYTSLIHPGEPLSTYDAPANQGNRAELEEAVMLFVDPADLLAGAASYAPGNTARAPAYLHGSFIGFGGIDPRAWGAGTYGGDMQWDPIDQRLYVVCQHAEPGSKTVFHVYGVS